MSSHSPNTLPNVPPNTPLGRFTCSDFQERFDAYVDDALDAPTREAAHEHLTHCRPCDREVVRWQQTRVLLTTAVTDFASTVDLSSLRADVEAALGLAPLAATPRTRHQNREAARVVARVVDGNANRRPRREAGRAASVGRRGFAAAWRFTAAASVSAAVAAAAVLVLTPAPQTSGPVVASTSTSPSSPSTRTRFGNGSFQPAAFVAGPLTAFGDAARIQYTPPPLAQPKVSHVDGLEAAPGQSVSTWVQPGTNARVIWVQDRGVGAPIRTAGLDR